MQKSVISSNVLEIKRVIPIKTDYEIIPLGSSEGNVYYAGNFDAHYDDAYNRVTCRCFADVDIQVKEKHSYNDWLGDCGIIGRSFAAHYINKKSDSIIDGTMSLIFRLQEFISTQYSLLAVIIWLKSPILLYHLYTVNGTYELTSPSEFNEIPIILVEQIKKGGKIDSIAQEIIIKEKIFLESISGIDINEIDDEIFTNHNKEILNLAICAEHIFCSILNISEDEYLAIIDFAEQEGWNFWSNYYKEKSKE